MKQNPNLSQTTPEQPSKHPPPLPPPPRPARLVAHSPAGSDGGPEKWLRMGRDPARQAVGKTHTSKGIVRQFPCLENYPHNLFKICF